MHFGFRRVTNLLKQRVDSPVPQPLTTADIVGLSSLLERLIDQKIDVRVEGATFVGSPRIATGILTEFEVRNTDKGGLIFLTLKGLDGQMHFSAGLEKVEQRKSCVRLTFFGGNYIINAGQHFGIF